MNRPTEELIEEINLLKRINATIDLASLIDLLAYYIERISQFYLLTIFLFDQSEDKLTIIKTKFPDSIKKMETILLNTAYPVKSAEAVAACYNVNELIFLTRENYENYGGETKKFFLLWGCEHVVFIPFRNTQSTPDKTTNNAIGVINICQKDEPIGSQEINHVEQLVNLFFDQVKNSIEYNQLKTKEREIIHTEEKNLKILEATNKINSLISMDLISATILKSLIELFSFELGLLFLQNDNNLDYIAGFAVEEKMKTFDKVNRFFKNVNGYQLSPLDGATPTSFLRNEHFYIQDIQSIINLPMSDKDRQSIAVHSGCLSTLITPIWRNEMPIGVIQLTSYKKSHSLTNADILIIKKICSLIGTTIANSKLYTLVEEQKANLIEKNDIIESKNKQIMIDLKLASHLQHSIVPSHIDPIPGIKITSLFKPMEELGGDFYDVIRLREPHLVGIFISDVSGHGVAAALITTMVKALIGASGVNKISPKGLLSYINKNICGQTNDNFISAFYALYNSENRVLAFARAGHNYPYLIRNKKIFELKSKGMPIGIFHDVNYEEQYITLEPGDRILFYTDGLVETINPKKIAFKENLLELMLQLATVPIDVFTREIYEELLRFKQSNPIEDDICIVSAEIE